MEKIDTKKYLPEIEKIVQKYDFPLEAIEVVKDIQKWCKEHNVEEGSSFRVGKCIRNRDTGKYLILLKSVITDENIQLVKGAMEYHGFYDELTLLKTKENFLVHLLLHEVAHALHNEWSEEDCDLWAFGEMKKHV